MKILIEQEGQGLFLLFSNPISSYCYQFKLNLSNKIEIFLFNLITRWNRLN